MIKYIFLGFLAVVFITSVQAQVKRCLTQEKMQQIFKKEPQTKIRFENTKRILDAKVREYITDPGATLNRSNAIIYIPVVVHILMDNPGLVSDVVVQSQIDTLNFYYGNAPVGDSLRVYAPFQSAYGRSQIRFCLAKRSPQGVSTNGIERVTTTETLTTVTAHPSTIVPAWNTQKYVNIWVANFTDGNLGYSYLPGTFAPGDEKAGIVVDYRAFGSGASFLYPDYNMGRTAVHEIGHFFNLLHTWGNSNNNPGCAEDDDIGDTPPTSGPFFGCPPSGPVTNACSPTAPGTMWQNHMDYANDPCMNLFTKQQVVRMETALNTAPDRNTLLNSNGCQAVVLVPNDAGIFLIVSPENANISCASQVTPMVIIRNYGTNTLTSAMINLTINGATVPGYPFSWNGSLSNGSNSSITLPDINLVPGTNVISISTSLPNGVADQDVSNDASSNTVSWTTPSPLPFVEGFESPSFPPTGWTIKNPDGGITWTRFTGAVAASGTVMTRINYFNYRTLNQADDLITPPLNAALTPGNKVLSFARAYRQYGNGVADQDTLEVFASADCGVTYTSIWKKWGASLATVSDTTTSVFAPTSSGEWMTESVDITPFASGNLKIKFKGINRFGNNLYLDDINIQKQSTRDLKIVSINNPVSSLCSPQVSPQVTVMNNGAETITSFELGYRIGSAANIIQAVNLSLNAGESATFSLTSSVTSTGNKTITAFTANPVSASGIGDVQKTNDTLRKNFVVVELINPPFVESFESTFPPMGWTLVNPNGNVTWKKKSPGKNSANAAFFNNFNTDATDQTDDLKSPYFNVAGADSIILSFDLAHKNLPSPANNDTLNLLVSTNCGNTYTSVYKKWGTTLSTAGSSSIEYLSPANSEWRNERIALDNVFASAGSIIVLIRNTNRIGNNIFVDNFNMVSKFKRDIQLNSISQPNTILCSETITPSVVVKNTGIETITSFKIHYSIDNTTLQTLPVSGIALNSNDEITISLNATTVNISGVHSMKVYLTDLVSTNGTGDMYSYNDTLTKPFTLAANVSAPLTESFESGFPPAQWTVINPDASITWLRYANGNGSQGSVYLNSFNYTSLGQKDDLVSPNVIFSEADSVQLTFDLAAVTYTDPGTAGISLDTLEVLVSKDCGSTLIPVYKKWGQGLQTVGIGNNPQTSQFFPTNVNQWRKEVIDLSSLGRQGPLMLFFRTTNNNENNIFIDNVNLTTRTLPATIKQNGYIILPSPFKNNFGVWHLQPPTSLKYISVYNGVGQLVWTKQFSGNAAKMEWVDMQNKAAGVYVVKLEYTDGRNNVSQKVVKTN